MRIAFAAGRYARAAADTALRVNKHCLFHDFPLLSSLNLAQRCTLPALPENVRQQRVITFTGPYVIGQMDVGPVRNFEDERRLLDTVVSSRPAVCKP